MQHIDSGDPALTRWWQGYAGLLDVSNPGALDWWLTGLRQLRREYGIDGFKFDGGEANFLPHAARSAGQLTPTSSADQSVASVARHFEWTEVRSGWRSQCHGVFFREWDRWSRWGVDNGLHSVLTAALTLGEALERCVARTLQDGTPMVRPLFWHAPRDEATYLIDDQFTLGDRLLVAPLLVPGARQRPVYLPAGRWRDYWTGTEHQGPAWLPAHPAPLETLPLFERVDGAP